MVVYNVFSHCVSYHYKTYLCSKATIIFIITSTLMVLFPLIFTYRSHGFWLRTDTYQEQPSVNFKYDYILIIDTVKQDSLIICSNLPHLEKLTKQFNYCPLIKAREDDWNRDGYNDVLHFALHVALSKEQGVHGLTLLLFFDYKLMSYCRVQMEALGLVQHSSALAGSGASIVADLSLIQRQPLSPKLVNTKYNTSVVPAAPAFSLSHVLEEYSLRNVSARLTNVYTTWTTARVVGEPFVLEATVRYSEATVRYTPSSWQVLKFGWMQFFPVLVISILVFKSINNFIFSNQLVYTYKEDPWKKPF